MFAYSSRLLMVSEQICGREREPSVNDRLIFRESPAKSHISKKICQSLNKYTPNLTFQSDASIFELLLQFWVS